MKKLLLWLWVLALPLQAQNFELAHSFSPSESPITDVIFSPSGKYFAVGCQNGEISVGLCQDQKVLQRLNIHNKKITDLQFSKDEKWLLSAGYDGFVKVCEWQNKRIVSIFENTKTSPYGGVQGIEPTFAVFTADEKEVFFGGYNLQLLKGKVGTNEVQVMFDTKTTSINCGALSPDGKYIAFGVSGSVHFWDIRKGELAFVLGEKVGQAVCEMNFSPKTKQLATWIANGVIKFWDINTRLNTENRKITNQYGSSNFGFSGDGNFLVTGYDAEFAKVWDENTKTLVQNLQGHPSMTDVVDFSPKNDFILTADKQILKFWKIKSTPTPEPTPEKVVFEETEIKINEAVDLKLQFPQSRATLTPESKAKLDNVFLFMQKYPTIRIKFEGHTDNIGDAAQNLALSTERCRSSQNYLVSKGISPERIEVEGFGGTKPIADNRFEPTRKLNRRVEMRILK